MFLVWTLVGFLAGGFIASMALPVAIVKHLVEDSGCDDLDEFMVLLEEVKAIKDADKDIVKENIDVDSD